MTRLLSFLSAVVKNRRGEVPRPGWCTYLVTYRCNARCGMCDSWRMKPGRELDADGVERVFRRLGALDVVRVTGGEPFLREDLEAVAKRIFTASRPRVLHVTTNGSLPARVLAFAERFPEPSRLAFLVSFDGHRQVHDESRGADVTYDAAMSTVRGLAAIRRRLGLRLAVNHTVISPRSMDDAARLRADLAPLGVEVQTVLAYAESSMYGLKLRGRKAEHLTVPQGYPLHPRLAGADVASFVRGELERAAASGSLPVRVAKSYYLRGLLARLEGRGDGAHQPRCVALRSHVRLLPDGRVPVCQFNTETVGDLASDGFEAIWHGAPATKARAWVDACPGCWAECEVLPSAVYSAELLLPRSRRSGGSARAPRGSAQRPA